MSHSTWYIIKTQNLLYIKWFMHRQSTNLGQLTDCLYMKNLIVAYCCQYLYPIRTICFHTIYRFCVFFLSFFLIVFEKNSGTWMGEFTHFHLVILEYNLSPLMVWFLALVGIFILFLLSFTSIKITVWPFWLLIFQL